MSLKIDTTYKGLAAPNSIVTVAPKSLSIDGDILVFAVMYQSGPEHEPFHWENHNGPYDKDVADLYAQAYSYLMTLPEFTNAVEM
ncbi:hypothetical protein D3C85_760090 [compost metagenome]